MAVPSLKTLASVVLNRDMDAWLLAQHADERSCEWMARQIAKDTNGVVTPDRSTVWTWMRALLADDAPGTDVA